MDRAKSLRIDLLRDVDAKTMAGALEDAFGRNLPPHTPLGRRSDRYLLAVSERIWRKGTAWRRPTFPAWQGYRRTLY